MFICLCHAVTDHDIAEAMEGGVDSVHALMETLKVATGCGSCFSEVYDMVESRSPYGVSATDSVAAPTVYRQNPSSVTVTGG